MARNIRTVRGQLTVLATILEEMIEGKEERADSTENVLLAEKYLEQASELQEILDLIEQALELAKAYGGESNS